MYKIDESDDEKDYEDDFEEESRKEPEDEDAEAERAFMKSKAAHDHVFPILVSELVQGDIVSRSHGERLLSLYQQGNNVVSAALDVYDTDQDMKELVDTLQRLVVTVDATPGAE